jgi:hypothetical protein
MKYLIDEVQAATFDSVQMAKHKVKPRDLRDVLRKAQRFVLNEKTSAMISDFSVAVSKDMDAACTMAIPPYPITWIEFDNSARLKRTRSRGDVQLVGDPAGHGDIIDRVGWLIQTGHGPAGIAGNRDLQLHIMTYHCMIDGKWISPQFSWCWTSQADMKLTLTATEKNFVDRYAFGTHTNCFRAEIIHDHTDNAHHEWSKSDRMMLEELAGELRHVFGFLVALNSSEQEKSGISRTISDSVWSGTPEPMFNGKPLFNLEHKILDLKLGARQTVEKVALRAITQARKKGHDVRGHLRKLRNEDGTIKRIVPVKDHHRGDDRLGIIKKTYRVD